jgi:rhodanese-related sulfurtransferase
MVNVRARQGGYVRPRRSIDTMLAEAREQLVRVTAREAYEAVADGALLVDIRPSENRAVEGTIPGALVIHRNVLEWRLDPESDARLPEADYDRYMIVVCNEGYTSSLAAAALVDLGVHRATDLIGGYRAWRAAGLPVEPALEEAV